MRCLVTGASGFIGSHLYAALKADNRFEKVVGISRRGNINIDEEGLVACNIMVDYDVKWIMKKLNPDIIFHLAGHSTVKLEDNFSKHLRINTIGTQNMLHYAPEGCKFVLASSATVYGPSFTAKSEDSKLYPTSVYATSKVAAENLLWNYSRLKDMRYQILRYIANVGRGATHGFLKDLVRKLKSDAPHLELLGKHPGSTKPYMHITDTVNATMHLAFNGQMWNTAYNITTEDAVSIEEIAKFAMYKLGIQKNILWNAKDNWVGDDREVRVSNYKLQSLANWEPKYKNSLMAINAALEEMT